MLGLTTGVVHHVCDLLTAQVVPALLQTQRMQHLVDQIDCPLAGPDAGKAVTHPNRRKTRSRYPGVVAAAGAWITAVCISVILTIAITDTPSDIVNDTRELARIHDVDETRTLGVGKRKHEIRTLRVAQLHRCDIESAVDGRSNGTVCIITCIAATAGSAAPAGVAGAVSAKVKAFYICNVNDYSAVVEDCLRVVDNAEVIGDTTKNFCRTTDAVELLRAESALD